MWILDKCGHCDQVRFLSAVRHGMQVERLQRKFATIHSTLAQQMSSKPDPEAQPDEGMISQSQALDGLSKVSPVSYYPKTPCPSSGR